MFYWLAKTIMSYFYIAIYSQFSLFIFAQKLIQYITAFQVQIFKSGVTNPWKLSRAEYKKPQLFLEIGHLAFIYKVL